MMNHFPFEGAVERIRYANMTAEKRLANSEKVTRFLFIYLAFAIAAIITATAYAILG